MLEINNFIIDDEEADDKYICYCINTSIKIFKQLVEDSEEIKIYISVDTSLENEIDTINQYLIWINQCEKTLRDFYEYKLDERVYDNWFNDIAVYNVDIVVNSNEDYGATIYCGDQVIHDHILEIQFDRISVETIGLNG